MEGKLRYLITAYRDDRFGGDIRDESDTEDDAIDTAIGLLFEDHVDGVLVYDRKDQQHIAHYRNYR